MLKALPLPSDGSAPVFFVDAVRGSDANPGSQTQPFLTPLHAVAACRAAGPGAAIVLREGVFHLDQALALGPQDSGWLPGACGTPSCCLNEVLIYACMV